MSAFELAPPEGGLTGVWSGSYWYGAGGGNTLFTARITEVGGRFVGTTIEPPTSQMGPGDPSAVIDGSRHAMEVNFTKIYDPANNAHGEAIFYSGMADAHLNRISGYWVFALDHSWRGGFEMSRVANDAKTTLIRT